MDIVRVLVIRRFLQRRRRARQLEVFRRNAMEMRRLRDASNPFELSEAQFRGKFRLSRELARHLINELIMRVPQRATATATHLKILMALNFLGHGSDQKSVAGDSTMPCSQAMVSLSLDEVIEALNNPAMTKMYVPFPQTQDERRRLVQRNYQRSKIPGVLGYVDGAHMLIVAPSIHEEQYVNRHLTHSLNVQVTCDSDMVILNILARHPGASHDSFIWANSTIRAKMEELYTRGEQLWLIGDSGYPLEPWLHVPYSDPNPGIQTNFNNALRIDRSVVERTIGHLRNRWRCLNKHRVLEYAPVKAEKIINACCVLHNMCVRNNIPPPSDSDDSDSDKDIDTQCVHIGGRARDRLLNEARTVRDRTAARVPALPPRQPFNPRRRHRRGGQ